MRQQKTNLSHDFTIKVYIWRGGMSIFAMRADMAVWHPMKGGATFYSELFLRRDSNSNG